MMEIDKMTDHLSMSTGEALERLANACGDHPTESSATWEIAALLRAGWKASMEVGDHTVTITLKMPKK